MTDRELIEHLSGQVMALTNLCGALLKSHIESKILGPDFFETYEGLGAMAESWKVSESWLAGLRQTQKSLSAFLTPD